MSIDQVTVHWCGHSEHAIARAPAFKDITNSLIEVSVRYFEYLKNLIKSSIPVELQVPTFREIIKDDLSCLGEAVAKPVTLRALDSIVNTFI